MTKAYIFFLKIYFYCIGAKKVIANRIDKNIFEFTVEFRSWVRNKYTMQADLYEKGKRQVRVSYRKPKDQNE